ncbi:MAG: hypothetical protein HXX15_21585 [Rhodopseudomonas sp.]|uniref:hypothetical protein n=1 Tax=Rhodopseudomonas sp. TaxID=1078 RepID=UPI001807BDE9|nr:hypothetical protein [Rhodopseudomonas sp.]NVN88681.1 hypothetical protein [Rhodopseudomonas sp.]
MSVLIQSLYAVPVVGWLAKDAIQGHPDAKYYFAFNAAAIFAALIYAFGYPFLITVAVAAAGCALASLVILTSFDAFGRAPTETAKAPRATRKAY